MKKFFLTILFLFFTLPISAQSAKEDCGCELRPAPDVIAVINEIRINEQQLDARLGPKLGALQQQLLTNSAESEQFKIKSQIYDLRKEELEVLINSSLLQQEAERLKTTAQNLLRTEINAKIIRLTEADAKKYFDQNKSRIKGNYEEIKVSLINYLQEQESLRTQNMYAAKLRANAKIATFLEAPSLPKSSVSIDDQPIIGNPDAPVTIIVFTDFECPSCALTHPVLESLTQEFADKIKIVMKDFPLKKHANALGAAVAARAARAQGKYREYAAILFANQKDLSATKLREYAAQAGLDVKKFNLALQSPTLLENVNRDIKEGTQIGINSTPSIFINGHCVEDRSAEKMKILIEAALKKTTP